MLLIPVSRPDAEPALRKDTAPMPEFQIEGETDLFDAADDIDVNGEISRYSFVTAEKGSGNVVVLSPVELKDLPDFEGILFQVDVNEEEDVVILRQVQMFFWPWEDDVEFEDAAAPDDDPELA
jgi:hypothetical protein